MSFQFATKGTFSFCQIGSLGAGMDVAIRIASGMAEILRRTPDISRRWALAGCNIGQDIMGTMTNILLFSYLSEVCLCPIYLKMQTPLRIQFL